MEPFWLVLAVALAAGSLGIKGLFSLVFAMIIFLIGSLIMVLGVSFAKSNISIFNNVKGLSRQAWSFFRGAFVVSDKLKKNESDVQELRLRWEAAPLTGKFSIL